MKKDQHLDDIEKMFGDAPIAQMEEHHYTQPRPIVCKWCGSQDIKKHGKRNGIQEYICLKCKRKFINKDAPYKRQTPTEQIGAALSMFYDGLSFADISRRLAEDYGNPVVESTVYRWVINYTMKAVNSLEKLHPRVGDIWIVDETVIKVGGRNLWFLDLIDEDTRFLLSSYLSYHRGILDVSTVMRRAWERADKAPRFIISDSWGVYPDGIERVFGSYAKHIQAKGISHEINTNLIERFHSTLKERTKVLRGFKTLDTAELLLEGFLVNYNFFRPHTTLEYKTPAEVAKLAPPFKTWTEFVRQDK